jgi:hypothetical protein
MRHLKTIIEPFRIKSVEPVKFTHRDDRERALAEAGHKPDREPVSNHRIKHSRRRGASDGLGLLPLRD